MNSTKVDSATPDDSQEYAEHIRELVESAPPLSSEVAERLRALLREVPS